jgi:hypothetical protein
MNFFLIFFSYTSQIFIEETVGADTVEHYLPVTISGLEVTGIVRMVDLETYGCSYTEDVNEFTYSCETKWINSFFDED